MTMKRIHLQGAARPVLLLMVAALAGCSLFTGSSTSSPNPDGEADPEVALGAEGASGDEGEEGEGGEGGQEGEGEDRDVSVVIGDPEGADPSNGGDDLEPYDEVVTEEAVTREGLFTVHRIDDDILFEIPDSVLEREMLVIARPVENSAQSGFYAGATRLVAQWERDGDRVVFREKLYEAVADSGDAIWRHVSGMRKGPIIAAFDVETFGADSAAVVEVTSLFTESHDLMGSVDGLDRDKTWIEEVMAFPRNVEVEATQTGQVRGGGGGGPGNGSTPVTLRIHWSMMLLPDEPMRPRLHDRRVGFINTDLVDYSRPEHRAEERTYIHRFRLEPSDTAAFRRGELVEPVEPIVYWVDPATPEWLQPWVVKGVKAWNPVFEGAGFRDAIDARVMPADDPAHSLYDLRYSVIYWRPSEVQNATGGQVVDPRSGEILKGEVNMYHNVQNLLRNWYFTQVGPLDPRARSFPLPDSLMGRMVEYVVTHEVGHSIGFPHNMKASAMYPPDSLRSESFLRRMNGHVATLMDYSRFNYVAQPEDSIPPELLIPRLGPYDEFAVRWGYRPILDAETPDEERVVLDRWAQVQDTVPWFRFTTADAPNDPFALTEAVGDADAVKSSSLGLENLERVMEMLIPVAEQPGENYELLEELYDNAVTQWSRYMGHVAAVVAGADTQERYGRGQRFFPLGRAKQEEAVAFLQERAFATPQMLIRPEILRRIEANGVVSRIRDGQAQVLETLLAPERLARLIEYEALAAEDYEPYTLAELMEDVRGGVWSELGESSGESEGSAVRIDVYRRNLQRSYLEIVADRLDPEEDGGFGGGGGGGGSDEVDPDRSDIRPVLRGELRRIRDLAERAAGRAADSMTRLHLEDVGFEISRILDPSE